MYVLHELQALVVVALSTGPGAFVQFWAKMRPRLGYRVRLNPRRCQGTLNQGYHLGRRCESSVRTKERGERKPKPHNFSARNDCASQEMWAKITHIFCRGPQESRVNLQVWRSARKKMRKLQSSQSYKVHMNRAAFLPASGGGGGGHAHGMALAPVLLGR